MSKSDPTLLKSIRNHLSPMVRMRKGLVGAGLLALSLFLVFGPNWEGNSIWLFAIGMIVAFVALGFGWAGLSQGLMGWSRQIDIDFQKNEVRQTSASILGRSKPFVLPLDKVANFVVKSGAVSGEGGDETEAFIELQDKSGHAMITAGMFDSREEADDMRQRMADAQAKLFQQMAQGN